MSAAGRLADPETAGSAFVAELAFAAADSAFAAAEETCVVAAVAVVVGERGGSPRRPRD